MTEQKDLPSIEQLANSPMIKETINYWFADHDHVRSPLPFYVHNEVRTTSVEAFREWMAQLDPKANEEINEEIAQEKFEEILFKKAMDLVKTEDEVLSLRFPFLPRVADNIDGKGVEGREGDNTVRSRQLITENKDEFMEIELENKTSGHLWTTRFELP